MRMQRVFSGPLVTIACAFAGGILLFPGPGSGQVVGPVPPPVQPPNIVPLTPVEQLGKDILFDHTLSDPVGYACFTCHVPETGFTGPSSEINAFGGPMPGVVPSRFHFVQRPAKGLKLPEKSGHLRRLVLSAFERG